MRTKRAIVLRTWRETEEEIQRALTDAEQTVNGALMSREEALATCLARVVLTDISCHIYGRKKSVSMMIEAPVEHKDWRIFFDPATNRYYKAWARTSPEGVVEVVEFSRRRNREEWIEFFTSEALRDFLAAHARFLIGDIKGSGGFF